MKLTCGLIKNLNSYFKENITLLAEDIIITSENNSGLPVISNTKFTVALDTKINDTLENEGISRELVNRIQLLRKERSLDVTDKINLTAKISVIGVGSGAGLLGRKHNTYWR